MVHHYEGCQLFTR
jgi:hypothetical protein